MKNVPHTTMSVELGNPKLLPWQEEKRDSNNNRSLNYLTLQEKEFLKTAEDEGFVQSLTEKHLKKNSRIGSEKPPCYGGDAEIVYLSYFHLKDISIIDICQRLQICILSNNFIQNIKPLKWCQNLVYLDLHSNLINHLPGKDFWASFGKLISLNLHDNSLSKLEELRHLARTTSLINLTLFDTPLSIKKTYRHCVVNAIWSLKALDYYVISDEEIIEDALFPVKFKPMQPHFMVPSFLPLSKRSSCPALKKTMAILRKEISSINHIQATYSPVLILQKYIRGFLIRLRYNYLMDTRLWAAVSIQRFYRGLKGYPCPPPTSPNILYQESMLQSLSSIKLDYETYLKMRRSRHKSVMSMKSDRSVGFRLSKKNGSPVNCNPLRKHISVDLERLECRTTELFEREGSCFSNNKTLSQQLPSSHIYPSLVSTRHASPTLDKEQPIEDMKKIGKEFGLNNITTNTKCKVGKYFTQYEFLGEVLANKDYSNESGDEVGFRLSISKPAIMKRDLLEELILKTVEGAEDIRESIKEIDRRIKSSPPVRVRKQKRLMTAVEKLSMKTEGTMALSCFKAVNRAYKDRQKAEMLVARMNYCDKIKQSEKCSALKVNNFKQAYKKEACVNKRSERKGVLEALALRHQKQEQYLQHNAAKRDAFKNVSRNIKKNYKFAQEFNCQNNSIGKALLSHDNVNRNKEVLKAKTRLVNKLKSDDTNQREVVQEYLEQTKMARQAERMNIKGDIDLLISRNTVKKQVELAELLNKRKAKDKIKLLSPDVLITKEFNPLAEENGFSLERGI